MDNEIETYIIEYFNEGLTYMEILEFLRVRHKYEISLSTIKRWLRENGIKRRPLSTLRSSNADVLKAIQDELCGSASDVGYRRFNLSS